MELLRKLNSALGYITSTMTLRRIGSLAMHFGESCLVDFSETRVGRSWSIRTRLCVKPGAFAPVYCDTGLTDDDIGGNITQILYETQETTSYAAYAQMDYNLTDDLTLTAGLRWTREEKDFVAGQAYLSNEARQRERNFPDYAVLSQEWTELSPKIGLTYQVNDDAIAFVSYSEGFHSGGFFGVNQNIRDFERDQYDPEYAGNWEIGYKSQLWTIA